MIRITHQIQIQENEIEEEFITASGPGGQHVNKTSTAVRLRFNVADSPSLPSRVKARLLAAEDQRVTDGGVLIITSQRYRSQKQNREDALAKLIDAVRAATIVPKYRVKTKPTKGSRERRLDQKRKRAEVKSARKSIKGDD